MSDYGHDDAMRDLFRLADEGGDGGLDAGERFALKDAVLDYIKLLEAMCQWLAEQNDYPAGSPDDGTPPEAYAPFWLAQARRMVTR